MIPSICSSAASNNFEASEDGPPEYEWDILFPGIEGTTKIELSKKTYDYLSYSVLDFLTLTFML